MKNQTPTCQRYISLVIALLLIFTPWLTSYADVLPQVNCGHIERWSAFQSTHIGARTIDIWLPNGYPSHAPYDVLYMHDGQMLFDAKTTWNKQEWRVDETACELQHSKKTRHFIVVGIWNAGKARGPEYFPQKPFEALNKREQDALYQVYRGRINEAPVAVYSDRYLRFLVDELKPKIDQSFRVATARQNTFIAGSSMGGLISMYAVSEYPDVFGGAACLSTHWTGNFSKNEHNPVANQLIQYVTEHLPPAGQHRIYFDHGTEGLDAQYGVFQRRIDTIMRAKGYGSNDWLTRVYQGDEHNENAWAKRLGTPLFFLFGE